MLARVLCSLKFCNPLAGWGVLTSWELSNSLLVPNNDVVDNIKLGVATKEQDDDSTSTLAASVTKPPKEQSINLIPFDKFNSYQKLLRVTAYMLHQLPSNESCRTVDSSIVDPVDLDEAERHLQYLVQGESFNTERRDLLDKKSVKRSSRIARFTPFIGPHGPIRSSGRLWRLVEIHFDTKHPIVLDAVILLLNCFCGILIWRTIIRALITYGQKYKNVVPSLNYVPHCIPSNLNCVLCRKFRAEIIQPIMVEPPKETLAYQSPPFTNTGVDYLGPFYVPVRTEKRWGFVFTCLTTRAVHVEVVQSLDKSSCSMGVERFVSRRGTPAMLLSDYRTNIIGAEK